MTERMKKITLTLVVMIGLLAGAWYMTPSATDTGTGEVVTHEASSETPNKGLIQDLAEDVTIHDTQSTDSTKEEDIQEDVQEETTQKNVSETLEEGIQEQVKEAIDMQTNDAKVVEEKEREATEEKEIKATEDIQEKETNEENLQDASQQENQVVQENLSTENVEEVVQVESIQETQSQESQEIQSDDVNQGQNAQENQETLTPPQVENESMPVEEVVVAKDEIVDGESSFQVTLSVSCETLLTNKALLDAAKHDLVPQDGWIYPEQEVTVYPGETVFDVLIREMKENKIHMEYVDTPLYGSAYIEGIHNLYEFDAGDLSGWMYRVNDWFPNYGASKYELQAGDQIEWVYTCDLGRDVGKVQ